MPVTPLQRDDDHGAGCLDAELIASYVDGRTTVAERALVEAHLATCEDCYFVFSETVREQAQKGDIPGTFEWRRWAPRVAAGFAAAAVLILAVTFGTVYYSRPTDLPIALNTLDAATGPYRPFEPRVTALPTYRQLVPTMRSVTQAVETSPALREAAAIVEKAAASGTSAQERRALAAMYFAQGQATRAIEVLTPLASSANDPALLNDIAAAYLSRGAEGDAKYALDLLERAVSVAPTRTEAWFNLGLAAEKTGQRSRAEEAWKKYLELDPSSQWAEEARRHLEALK